MGVEWRRLGRWDIVRRAPDRYGPRHQVEDPYE
jgi:hypothetical protein